MVAAKIARISPQWRIDVISQYKHDMRSAFSIDVRFSRTLIGGIWLLCKDDVPLRVPIKRYGH